MQSKKGYKSPSLEYLLLNSADIILASDGGNTGDDDGSWGLEW